MNSFESIIDKALDEFGAWLCDNDWRGREHDCVSNFAHAFLMNQITPGGPLHHPAQICFECDIAQPEGFTKIHARRDLVVWAEPFQNTWSCEGRRLHDPVAIMEWKAKKKNRLPKVIFYPHDEDWILKYSKVHPKCVGYVTALYFLPQGPSIFWKTAKHGVFSDVKMTGSPNPVVH